MKTLSSDKNMPSIEIKATRKIKGLATINNVQNRTFNQAQQLIFKIELLPVALQLQIHQFKQMTLQIGHTSVQIKRNAQKLSFLLNIGKFKWIRFVFGQQVNTVELKCCNSECKSQKNHIFTKYQTWKCLYKEQMYTLNLQPMLLLLMNKGQKKDKLADIHPKNSLTSFMKTRFSQRNNIKQSLLPFRAKHETSSNITENHNFITTANESQNIKTVKQRHSTNKMQSQRVCSTLDIQKERPKNKCFYNLKQSNTSTSISLEPDVNFSKRLRRIRDIVDLKATKSQKQVAFDGSSEVFQLRKKPKFYQHVNLSQEQIQIKRKKFDSQFICKKQMIPLSSKEISSLQNNDSEVTEDICKMQSSKSSNLLEDTLQKGFAGNKEKGCQIQESGTLYESVYE